MLNVDETKAASECECMSSASVSTFKYEIFSYEMRQYCKSRRAVMELKVQTDQYATHTSVLAAIFIIIILKG